MKIAIGSDHAGFLLKEALKAWLGTQDYLVEDLGTYSTERVDYPHFGAAVANAVASGRANFGVAVCGSGQGICMAVNKVSGARGGVIRDSNDAEMTRRHNNANVACFGESVTSERVAIDALHTFLTTGFDGGRHAARVAQLGDLDRGEPV